MSKSTMRSRIMSVLCSSYEKCERCGIRSKCDLPTIASKVASAIDSGQIIDTPKSNEWKSVEEELPINEDSNKVHNTIGVIVYVEGETKPSYRIYERATVRDKVVYRWKYPWDRISDEKITHWRYLPEKE